jgi:hypothetical protein
VLVALLLVAAAVGTALVLPRDALVAEQDGPTETGQLLLSGDFRNNLWGPAHLLVQGQSPYRVEVLFPGEQAVWFPQAIGVFFPLGWLNVGLAANLWFTGNIVLVLGLLWWHRGNRGSLGLLWALLLALLFPPLLFHFVLGQFDLLVLVLLLAATYLATTRRYLGAGLLVSLALAKPQLAVLALPGLWVAAWKQDRLRGGLLFPAGIILGGALLTLSLWVAYPAWPLDFAQALFANPDWFQPTLYTMVRLWWGEGWMVLPALLSLVILGLNLWLWWQYQAEEVLPWSLALTTIASPYMWTWDFMLFLPLLLRSLHRSRSWAGRAIWGVGLAASWGLTIWVRQVKGPSVQWHFWMPWFFMGFALVSYVMESRRCE